MLQRNETRNTILFYGTLLLIVVVSWSFYATCNYPLLSSDDGLNVLMAHYYDLPQDFYCWGQDRGGTIIPFFSQLWIKGFGLSAIDAISVSNYIILILGYIGFASMLKKRSSRLLFALIWFLPFQRFVDLTRFPIGVQYSLIAFCIFLMMRVRFEGRSFFYWRNHVLLATITLLLGLSVWASDLSAISIAILLVALLIHHYLRNRTLVFRKEIWLYLIGGIVFWAFFLLKAKSYASHKTEQFATLNNWNDILQGLGILKQAIVDLLLFKEHDYFTSLYAWLVPVLLVVLIVLILRKKVRIAAEDKRWTRYLALDFFGILSVILLSHWVLINQMGRWYFVATYVTLSMLVLIVIEHLDLPAVRRRVILGFTTLIVLIGSASTFYNMRFVTAKTFRSTADLVGEFKQLGHIGIIAEYWNAYRTSCPNPETIKATPHDQSDVRKQLLVDEVFAQPKLYVIRDIWMDNFPDTLHQFGFTLVRAGRPFFIGGCNTCRYRRLNLTHTYRIPELKSDPSFVSVLNGDSVVRVTSDMPNALNKHIVFGPFCSLLPGTYKVRYYLRATHFNSEASFGLIDIAAEYGQIPLLVRPVSSKDFRGDRPPYLEVELKVAQRVSNVEFRFLYTGNADVVIDQIELIEP